MTPELADRAEDVVESTAISIEPEPDDSFREMLDYARREIRELREELRKP
jgi:predicted HTH domain antitoxin